MEKFKWLSGHWALVLKNKYKSLFNNASFKITTSTTTLSFLVFYAWFLFLLLLFFLSCFHIFLKNYLKF